jgi:membrane fusion protein, heavy metal efflux system
MNGFWPAALVVVVGGLMAGCKHDHGSEAGHGHDHGDGHAHGAAAAEAPTLAITRWTDRYELFIELPVPEPGKPVSYHAHVTRLDGFQAVTEGTFRVRYKTPTGVAAEAQIQGVKRPGIFVPEGPAPQAGTYPLEAVYEHAGVTDVFDCGTVKVQSPPAVPPEEPGSTITFLKESQWKIPFGTAWAGERPLASETELPATVEPAGTDQLTVAAPTGGRFFHNPKLSLAEGTRVKKGDVIGTIVPTVAGDDFNRLQLAVEESRLEKSQLEREIQRVEPLVQQNLLPERRLIELKNQLERESARLSSASSRLGRVTASGGDGGLQVRSTIEGLVSQVLVPNGEPVAGAAPLVRIGGTDHLWVRARFVARPSASFTGAEPASVRLPSGARVDFSREGARFLSQLPVVETSSRVATWIVDVAREAKASTPTTDLRPGVSVVLSVRLGQPENVLAVERSAVVEINTRPFVFVQVDGEHFEKRAVTLGRSDGAYVQIVSGVRNGDRVVDKGGYDIHLASLMGTVESHRH